MNRCIFLLSLLMALMSSCQKERQECIPVNPLSLSDCDEVACYEIAVDSYLLSYPTGMFIVDGRLVIKDDKGQGRLFHMITTEGKTVQEFLEHGEGPMEYVSSNLNAQLSDSLVLEMFDSSRRSVLSFKGSDGKFIFSSSVSAKTSEEYIREMVNCGNCYLAMGAKGRFDNNRFLVLDTLGNVRTAIGEYPVIQSDLFVDADADLQTMLFHTSFFRVSPDRRKAVFASYKGALIQFLDLSSLPDSVSLLSFQLERPKKKEQITREHEGWVYGFEDVYVTNNHVYAIYNGETAVDNPELGRHVLKYDWEGNLLKRYKFDVGLRSLAVDEASGMIYFVGYVRDEMVLFYGYL